MMAHPWMCSKKSTPQTLRHLPNNERHPFHPQSYSVPISRMPNKQTPSGLQYGIPKPEKKDRIGVKRKKQRKKDDDFWQSGVPELGNCFNCKKWRYLCGDHEIPRRFGKTRQDPANRRNCCKQCNGELEALSCEKLTEKYPTSPLIPEWKETINRKTL
jgi:5-methylcytosine-specific restriction endonuclease McrA